MLSLSFGASCAKLSLGEWEGEGEWLMIGWVSHLGAAGVRLFIPFLHSWKRIRMAVFSDMKAGLLLQIFLLYLAIFRCTVEVILKKELHVFVQHLSNSYKAYHWC